MQRLALPPEGGWLTTHSQPSIYLDKRLLQGQQSPGALTGTEGLGKTGFNHAGVEYKTVFMGRDRVQEQLREQRMLPGQDAEGHPCQPGYPASTRDAVMPQEGSSAELSHVPGGSWPAFSLLTGLSVGAKGTSWCACDRAGRRNLQSSAASQGSPALLGKACWACLPALPHTPELDNNQAPIQVPRPPSSWSPTLALAPHSPPLGSRH